MLIDWFTIVAQIINFLILVFLLKHFLYGPVIRAMDRREEKIAERLEEAARKRAEAEAETETFRSKNKEFDERKKELFFRAHEEAEEEKKDMIEKARRDAEDFRERWRGAVEDGKKAFLRDLKQRAGAQICEIAGRALKDLSDVALEDHIIDVFLESREKFGDEMDRLREAAADSGGTIIVSTAFGIADGKRREITEKIHSVLAPNLKISFRTAPDLICGIELRLDNFVVGWNLKDYIGALEEEIGAMLDAGTRKDRGVDRRNEEDEK